jgi:hypothetical protein
MWAGVSPFNPGADFAALRRGVQRAEAVAAAASAGAASAALASENRRLRIENKAASPRQLEYPLITP